METEVAGGEVELLVEARIVRDVHLAVLARKAAVLLQHHRGVVVQAGATALEQRTDDDHAVLLRQRAQALGARAGDGFGQLELAHVLVLAEVGAVVQFLQQHQACAGLGGLGHALFDHRQVGFGVAVVGFLDQGDGEGFVGHGGATVPAGSCMVRQCRLPFCQIRARQGTCTTSRSGKACAITPAARPSAGSP